MSLLGGFGEVIQFYVCVEKLLLEKYELLPLNEDECEGFSNDSRSEGIRVLES